jgi:hypothetical protein
VADLARVPLAADLAPGAVGEPGAGAAPEVATVPDPIAAPGAPGPPAPRETLASDGPLLDPAGYRLRIVRDAAAALSLVLGALLVLSLVARPGPTGDVLSATGAPGGAAGDPRGGPGILVPAGGDADGAGTGIAASPDPGGTTGPGPIPTPTPGPSASARPVP